MKSPTEEHLAAAFRDLVAEQPFTPDVPAIEHRARQARRRHQVARGGIGAGVIGDDDLQPTKLQQLVQQRLDLANSVVSRHHNAELRTTSHRAAPLRPARRLAG